MISYIFKKQLGKHNFIHIWQFQAAKLRELYHISSTSSEKRTKEIAIMDD